MTAKHTRTLCLLAALLGAGGLVACSNKTAEEKGTEMATEKLDTATGIGKALEEKGTAAGESVVTGLGKVMKGMEKGVNKSGRAIVADPSVDKASLKITTVNDAPVTAKHKHGIDVYVLAEAPANGKLRVLAYDVMDKEIGRASVQLAREADEAKYQHIELDEQVNLSAISKLVFDFKPSAVLAAKK